MMKGSCRLKSRKRVQGKVRAKVKRVAEREFYVWIESSECQRKVSYHRQIKQMRKSEEKKDKVQVETDSKDDGIAEGAIGENEIRDRRV
jgi:ABC-type uncharacterized transport system ATPase subunit